MKKLLMMMLCLMLALLPVCTAMAQGAQPAAQLVEMERFAHYPSYQYDAETGKWSIRPYQADALVDRFLNFGIKNSSRIVVFHLGAEGDARTGVWSPVLRIYHMDGETVNARAVCFLVDGVRYELAASSSVVKNGRYTAECITVPLDAEGMQLMQQLKDSQKATLRLVGENLHTVQLDAAAASGRAALEGESLKQVAYGVELMNQLGADSYALWDLSAAAWEQTYGYRPATLAETVELTVNGQPVADAFGMVLPDTTGAAATAAQEVLAQYGFLSGTPAKTFDAAAVNATLRAQQYLGLVPTGCFDSAFAAALAKGRQQDEKAEVQLMSLGETAQIGLNRYWFADAVSAQGNAKAMRSVVNADNVLLIAEGSIRNMSAAELHLFMQLEARVVYNGKVAYDAEMVCECSGGADLDVRLLPLAQARLLVYAEIPTAVAQDAQAEWSIVFESAGESLSFELQ